MSILASPLTLPCGCGRRVSSEPDLDVVFQVVNLWFGNAAHAQVNDVLLQSVVNHVASYKFVPLAYQIFSRLGADEADPHPPTGFQTVLKQLMVRMCREHPHHVLPQLFALAHGGDVSGRTAAEYRRNISRARCEAASALLGEVRAQAPGLQALVDAMDALLQANIALANHCTQAFVAKGQTKGIAFVDLLGAGAGRAGSRSRARGSGASSAGAGGDGAGAAAATRAFHECMEPYAVRPAVLSVTHRLRPDHDYEADGGAVRVAGYQPTFSITDSGISRPKIVECLGSDGTVYRQLVKGGDDMRQDAVMEQVFEHVNHTLQGDDETRRRRLRIRTYKIVPTTPQTGVIEWVIGAQAFGAYLTTEGGVGGAHGRYYPTDWSTKQCRDHLTEKVNANNEKVRPALRSFLSLPPLRSPSYLSPSLSPSFQHPRLCKGPALLGPRAAGAPAGDLPELPPRLPLLLFGEVPGPHALGELPPGLHAQVGPI